MKRILPAAIGGLLVAASMPPWGWWPLGIFGIMLYASSVANDESGFGAAFVFALGWFVPTMWWLNYITVAGMITMVMIFALMHGAAGVMARAIGYGSTRRHRSALVVCHTLAEVLRMSFPFGGAPIATIAIGQVGGPFSHLASVGGAVGITWAVWWFAASKHRIKRAVVLIAMTLIAPLFGSVHDTGNAVRIALVQGGGPQGTHAIDTVPLIAFSRHLALTKTIASDSSLSMVVWPENVVNMPHGQSFAQSEQLQQIAEQAARLNVPFVVGITEDATDNKFANDQVVISPAGDIVDRYEKVRPVPFGEVMPMRTLLTKLGAPTNMVPQDARIGHGPAVLHVGDANAAVVISWEVFFGGRANAGVKDGGGFILNPSNASSYTGTSVQTQQVASARLRALEQSRWLGQVSPTGFSSFVSPSGHVYSRSTVSEAKIITRTIPIRSGRTP
jgi:apolipoprotein N-acyltransferase